ncbi:MAG TPA: 30S ribosomal protein S6 [Desulfotomaculum sp.]|nr:MAG: 30S ribosomal protein S6 [Desulfotomaculum sp. 46_80]HAG10687.1 30S ribosomal protein S6 [Desulfotomaculum sp.]HBY04968.1 30S ribosomal protein S6 [Desulfotomaculum sp.]
MLKTVNYESLFILRPDLDEEKITEMMEKFRVLIEKNGGEVTRLDKWGRRRLAYEIKHLHEGLYIILQFKSGQAVVKELDRVFKITDEVIRHITVREAS